MARAFQYAFANERKLFIKAVSEMNKSDIKVSDLLERVRRDLRAEEGEPEPLVLTEELIIKNQKELDEKKQSAEERGKLIRELFGENDGAADPELIEGRYDPNKKALTVCDDDDLPTILEDMLAEGLDEAESSKQGRGKKGAEYDLISIYGFGMHESDEDETDDDGNQKTEKEELPADFIEYESRAQIRLFAQRFKNEHKRIKTRIVLLSILAAIGFLIENVVLWWKDPVGFLSADRYPEVYYLLGLQVFVLCFALTCKKVAKGYSALFKGVPIFESYYSIVLTLTGGYMAYLFFVGIPKGLIIFNLPMLMLALLCEYSDRCKEMRKFYSFNVLVDKNPKTVIEKQSDDEIEQELAELDDFIDKNTNFLKVLRTEKIDGFFKRFEKQGSESALMVLCIPIALFFCVATALFTYIRTDSIHAAVQGAMMVFGLCAPVCMCLSLSFPAYQMARRLLGLKTAVIGNDAIEEYSSPAVMQMKDTDIFPSRLAGTVDMETHGDAPIYPVLHYCGAVLSPLGGPLGGLFRKATADFRVTKDVDYIKIEDDGIECAVEDHHIFIGKYAFVNRYGYSLHKQTAVDEPDDSDVHSVYMVMDDRIVATFRVRYVVCDGLAEKLEALKKAGIGVCVRTFDPNITTDMIMSMIRDKEVALRVIKCKKRSQRASNSPHSSSGIITGSDVSCLYTALAQTERCKIIAKALSAIGFIGTILGGAVGCFLLFAMSMTRITSAPVLLFYLFWMTLSYLITKMFN